MTWFAAHIIIGMKPQNATGQPISVYENVILIEAPSSHEAHSAATKIGQAQAELDDNLTIDGIPAKRIFAGIRKIISISNPYPLNQDEDQPISGTEITYSEFEVENDQALYQLASGEEIYINYIE
ncbi:hypothetical protein Z042_14740 [Chania multitudinisentens RB-25]|uniref:DUF4288 domain-containing protein n=1 Tax=Chania multitudinisentens RB-25 TaxID=1441930 RepID=W0LG32_9GAMM|nr:hypothetical protein [Chania multitudinisentens]AHG22828.1 hypothetical protein Z042_14740 [Chania multitudinisentens RB-25]